MSAPVLRIALAQMEAAAGDVSANRATTVDAIRRAGAEGAALVAFPELSLTGYELGVIAERSEVWFTIDDARLDPVRLACADARVTAVVGAPVHDPDGTPRLAALIVTPEAGVHVWHKQHLHGAETTLFRGGEAGAPFLVAGWRVALGVCFDAARPTHAAQAAARGADLYLVTALYAAGEERRVDLHLGARAMDNRMFAALANYAGTTGGYASVGGSGAWRPDGDVLRRAGTDPALIVAELDPAELRAYR